jgi:hypothetical protein
MARILITWELGGGLGHLVRLQPLAAELLRRGHRVAVALRDLSRAAGVFRELPVTYFQAPVKLSPLPDEFRPPRTFPQILHNVGFGDEAALATLCAAWRALFDAIRPDVMVCDHSPTALLASRGLPVGRAIIGTGFCCPPDEFPMRDLRPWAEARLEALGADEQRILDTINRVLAAARGGPPLPLPLDRVAQLFTDVDRVLLTTFPELDHYPPADRPPGTAYRGVWNRAEGKPPRWPAGSGMRVYAYLKPFEGIELQLARLNELRCPAVIVVDGIQPKVVERFRSATLRFERERLDISLAARECDLAILNGTHGTVAALLLAGKPVLNVPLFLEQGILSRTVARLGAGLYAPARRPADVVGRLDEMMRSPNYGRAAAAFARRYASFDALAEYTRMADEVEQLVR